MIMRSVLLLSLLASATAQFLNEPTVRWTYSLSEHTSAAHSIGPSSSVVVAADGSRLYLVDNQGALHVIVPGDRTRSTVTQPALVEGSTTTVASPPVLWETAEEGVQGVFYAVHDTVDDVTNSHIVAVDKDGASLWTVGVEGKVVGSPIVSDAGDRIFVVSNRLVSDNLFNGSTRQVGRITVLSTVKGGLLGRIPDPNAAESNLIGALGPATSGGDILVVARMPQEDTTVQDDDTGSVYLVQPSAVFEQVGGKGPTAYDFLLVSEYPQLTTVRPTLDGEDLYLVNGERLTAWVGQRNLGQITDGSNTDIFPTWEQVLAGSGDGTSMDSVTTPVLSSDGSMLYVIASGPRLVAVDIDRARVDWSETLTSASTPSIMVSSTQNGASIMVYVVETTGVVRAYDGFSGNIQWETTCATFTANATCTFPVQASMGMTSPGNTLYLSSTDGTVVALAVAEFQTVAPTEFPTGMPSAVPSVAPTETTHEPTPAPFTEATLRPTFKLGVGPSQIGKPTNSQASALSLPVILSIAIGGLALLVVVTLFCLYMQRSRPLAKSHKPDSSVESPHDSTDEEEENYERECKAMEEATLKELAAPMTPSPEKSENIPSNGMTPPPLSLGVIAETPEEVDDATLSDADTAEAGFEVSLAGSVGNSTITSPELVDNEDASTSRNLSDSFSEVAETSSLDQDATSREIKLLELIQKAREEKAKEEALALEKENELQMSPALAVLLSDSIASESNVDIGELSDEAEEEPGYIRPAKSRSTDKLALSPNTVSPKTPHSASYSAPRSSPPNSAGLVPSPTPSGTHSASRSTPVSPGGGSLSPAGDRTLSPAGIPMSPVGRAVSPSFSDIWSVDDSLYVDDDTVGNRSLERRLLGDAHPASPGGLSHPVSPGSLSHPDDESLVGRRANPRVASQTIPFKPTLVVASEYAKPTAVPAVTGPPMMPPMSNQIVENGRSAPVQPSYSERNQAPAAERLDAGLARYRRGTDRVSVYGRGGSARPKAGMLTRRQDQFAALKSRSDPDTSTGLGYMEEREGRAVVSVRGQPSLLPNEQSRRSPTQSASHRPSPRVERPRASPQSSATSSGKSRPTSEPVAYRAWNSFLNELAKAEEQFFNPKLPSTSPPQEETRKRVSPQSSPPPPPPPPDSSSDESSTEVYESEWDYQQRPVQRYM